MSNATQNPVAATQQPATSPSATPNPVVASEAPVPQLERNGVKFTLKRTETERVKAGETAIAYYTLDLSQFEITEVKGPDGKVTTEADSYAIWLTSDTLLGHDIMLGKLQAKLNQDCRAAQMEAGKDVYTMAEKLEHITAYVNGGFGAERSGGVTSKMYSELKKLDARKSELLIEMAGLGAKLVSKDTKPTDYPAIIARINAINAETTALTSVAAK